MTMKRALLVTVASGLLVLRAGAAMACDPSVITSTLARARRAEEAHAPGAAIELRTQLLACPSGAHTVDNRLALARDHASLGDFSRAADLLEALAEGRAPDAVLLDAMREAVGYRIALGDPTRAKGDVVWMLAVDASQPTLERAFETGDALEASRMWTEASQWYQQLARRFPRRSRWRVQVRALTGLARAYEALGDVASASRQREAVLALWPSGPRRARRTAPTCAASSSNGCGSPHGRRLHAPRRTREQEARSESSLTSGP